MISIAGGEDVAGQPVPLRDDEHAGAARVEGVERRKEPGALLQGRPTRHAEVLVPRADRAALREELEKPCA